MINISAMNHFFNALQHNNAPLFIFGCVNTVAAVVFVLLTRFSNIMVTGVNAWFKPLKFALSIGIFSFTMGWYTAYLHLPGPVNLYSWIIIIFLGFENVYITLQAGRGQMSHYNTSSPVYLFLYNMMGLAAVIVTLWTGYICVLFFNADLPGLPVYYVLSIRAGLVLFIFFSFQGASMGARMAHTVGGPDGGAGLPIVNWSTRYGDLRVAHFIGMHALQVLPLLSWYILRNTIATAIAVLLYALLAIFTLARALKGKPLAGRSNLSA
jgi:hypothetical protein